VSVSGPPAPGERAPFAVAWIGRLATALADWAPVLVRRKRAGEGPPLVPTWRRYAGVSIVAVLAILATMVFFDAAAMEWQKRLAPSWVALFEEITDYGRSGWFLLPIGVVMLALAAISSPALGRVANLVLASLIVRLGYVFVAIALPGIVITIGKRLIGRVRPSDLGPFAYEPLSWRATYASLPSGHATAVFSALVAIGTLWPRARPVLWVYALVIALSRIIVSAHYPSDVLAGALCGVLGALLVRDWFAARRLGFFVGRDGQVRRLPGPSWARLKGVAGRLLAP
jgi:membrane-associated phospholipid phosphatase